MLQTTLGRLSKSFILIADIEKDETVGVDGIDSNSNSRLIKQLAKSKNFKAKKPLDEQKNLVFKLQQSNQLYLVNKIQKLTILQSNLV